MFFATVIGEYVIFICFVCFCLNVKGQEMSPSSIMVISNLTTNATTSSIQKIPTNPETTPVPKTSTSTSPAPTSSTITPTTTTVRTTPTTVPSTSSTARPVTISTVDLTTPEASLKDKCPDLSNIEDLDSVTQEEFISKLTDSCRYDRLIKPITEEPLDVYFQIDMTHIESSDHLQLKAHILVQLLYRDERLAYSALSPKRGFIMGEEDLRNKIWVPHIIVQNERQSSLMGIDGKDVFVHIAPNGQVIYSYRMTTMFYCWMNLKKFPFDHQICDIRWVSWAYNTSNLRLVWEEGKPYQVANNLHLTEFVLEEKWCEATVIPPSFDRGGLVEKKTPTTATPPLKMSTAVVDETSGQDTTFGPRPNSRDEEFLQDSGSESLHSLITDTAGNYSGVIFKLKLRREVGYYMLDYFLPSILLVCMSWVTFWLQADAAPPRVTLGTSTMLTFITLNGSLSKSLPKVSYIKASEIWFFGCASFIFFSLAEFAFVNVIWRRKKKVELKKQNSKHILKGALTPSLARKQLRKASSVSNLNTLYKTRSCSSLDSETAKNMHVNYLTVHSFPSSLTVPTIQMDNHNELLNNEDTVTTIPIPGGGSRPPTPPQPAWTTMTPQEVAIWIDKKSRIVFPVSFLIFNLFYWSFVYAL